MGSSFIKVKVDPEDKGWGPGDTERKGEGKGVSCLPAVKALCPVSEEIEDSVY